MNTVAASVKTLTNPVGYLGGYWMLHREVLGSCRDVGYPHGYAYYVAGRGGVLGDVDSDVVASAFGFFEPSIVRKMWEIGRAVEGASAAAARYGAACAEFGRTRLQGFDDVSRFAELAGKVTGGADVAGLALFAGWRAQQLPGDIEGRAYFLLHLMRELRGSAHVLAIVAAGLSPRAAVFASGGAAQAQQFGWPEPYDDVATADKGRAEKLTDAIVTRLYANSITAKEAAELAELVVGIRAHFDAAENKIATSTKPG